MCDFFKCAKTVQFGCQGIKSVHCTALVAPCTSMILYCTAVIMKYLSVSMENCINVFSNI